MPGCFPFVGARRVVSVCLGWVPWCFVHYVIFVGRRPLCSAHRVVSALGGVLHSRSIRLETKLAQKGETVRDSLGNGRVEGKCRAETERKRWVTE